MPGDGRIARAGDSAQTGSRKGRAGREGLSTEDEGVNTVKLAFGLLNNLRMAESVAIAERAEELGYESIWFAEHNFSRDGVSICAAASARTKRIRIGPCVVPIFTRSALLLATTFAALDELSNGRIVLGVGAGSRLLVRARGINSDKPVTALREYIEACRAVWRAQGTHVSYHGQIVSLEDAELD